jgi:hypothetical protein
MELFTLDAGFQLDEVVERYDSLIWTERYASAGDFTLVTTDVARMIKLLPLESYVSLRETTVPMIVEIHKIEKKGGAPVLTVTGRSFESVLERRVTADSNPAASHARVAWIESREKESDAAYIAIRKILGDVARPPLSAQAPILDADDAIPQIDLTLPADYVIGTSRNFEIKPGNLYSVALELLTTNHHGLKAVRPDVADTKVGIEIYNGADLTQPNDPAAVVFNAKFDQFDDATYLLSLVGSTNVAYVFSKTGSQVVQKNAGPSPTGLNRRVLYLDVSSEDGTDSQTARQTRALIELYKYNATALFDGQVAQQVAAGFNNRYFLGDIIRLDGEYGLSEFVRVAEFIRSDDNTGSKAYPTFEVVSA